MAISYDEQPQRFYRIGVDVGGTNTDSAVACATVRPSDPSSNPSVQIIASQKSPTTADVTTGICDAIRGVLESTAIPRTDILSVNIGTTHFINAIVQSDRTKIARVAVLRLCGPFCREVSPFVDFPEALRNVIEGHVGYLDGGLEIDGRPIRHVNEEEVLRHAQIILESGITDIVVVGVFSPLDSSEVTQEQQVKTILHKVIPHADVVCSRDIGRVGFLERENASILNAAILKFGRKTISAFQDAIASLELDCPLYLTQNDGTALDAASAALAPIRTFSSGATNSLTGALFLSSIHEKGSDIDLETSQVLMVDIGGTTSDFAALSKSGFPRQSSATVTIGGVRTAFSMPEVASIGLGGGSRVAVNQAGKVSVGPTSVGYMLPSESRCFGGNTLTATDIAVASGSAGDISTQKVGGAWIETLSACLISEARLNIKKQIEKGVEKMKTSDLDVVLLLVGGGSIIVMDDLSNVKRCIRPPFSDVANAVGAAISKISGEIDNIHVPGNRTDEQIVAEISEQAIQLAIKNGAYPDSVRIVERELIPLQYVSNRAVRAVAKAVGELQWKRSSGRQQIKIVQSIEINGRPEPLVSHAPRLAPRLPSMAEDIEGYVPNVSSATREWFVSATDLAFMAEGNGVLGTGGGGSVYTAYLNSLEQLGSTPEGKMRIIEPSSLEDDAEIASIAYFGAPSVSNERLTGHGELQFACSTLAKYRRLNYAGVLGAEIGGSNGMRAFTLGASMDLPVIDADTMGRAFPKVDLSLPYVYGVAEPAPAVLSDARGNVQIIAAVEDSHRLETMLRTASVELGLFTGLALNPLPGNVVKNHCTHGSLSTAWYIGRAIYLARQKKLDIVQSVLSAVEGGVKLYSGKIIGIERNVQGGYTIGTATLEIDENESPPDADPRPMILQYQNEFLFAALVNPDSSSEVVCTTPDLITVLDQDGAAIGSHELRYGLRVSVLALPAHPLWKSDLGLKAAGPKAFGLKMEYEDVGLRWTRAVSVIEEFAT